MKDKKRGFEHCAVLSKSNNATSAVEEIVIFKVLLGMAVQISEELAEG